MADHITKAVLLAGGLGTRLRPLTEKIPKCLVPIAGRPLLDYWMDSLSAAGVREALVNNHHLPDQLREYINRVNGDGSIRLAESYEPTLLGSAGTLHANRNWIGSGETALIIYADNLSSVDLRAMLDFHHAHGEPITMMLFRTQHPERCGIARMQENGRITEFVEKPKHNMGNLANAGVYALTAAAYHEMADMNKFDLGFDVLPKFVGRMRGWVLDGYHRDIGTLESLEQANEDAITIFRGIRK
jgi:mannose-1-phosphate guanylyltransferase